MTSAAEVQSRNDFEATRLVITVAALAVALAGLVGWSAAARGTATGVNGRIGGRLER